MNRRRARAGKVVSVMKKSLLFSCLVFLALLGACSSRSSDRIFDSDTGRHIADWLVEHRSAYRQDSARCKECHGGDLSGGIARVGCNNAATGCHGHDPGWDDPDIHGAIAKTAPRDEGGRGLSSCRLCHGDDFSGTLLSNDRSCFEPGAASSCHDTTTNPDRRPGAPHPAQWRSTTNTQRRHTDTDQANAEVCADCHTADKEFNTNPQSGAPGCFNGTLCHQDVTGCDQCHGDRNGKYYPPVAVHGSDLNAASGVGAHVHHIESTASLMSKDGTDSQASVNWCNECHVVPASAGDAGHIDAVYPADVDFSSAVESKFNSVTPSFTPDPSANPDSGTGGTCSVYCHGAKLPFSGGAGPNPTPAWGDSSTGCDYCHGAPPSTGGHTGLVQNDLTQCVACHPDTVDASGGIATPANHIDGNLQVQADCWDCHGDGASKDYPPVAVHGSDRNAASGVGAHVTHIESTASLLTKEGAQSTTADRWCNECHAVPADTGDAGHIDSGYPGDVSFANGTESAYNSTTPSFTPDPSGDPDSGTGGTCSVYCHGANMPNGSNNGTKTNPAWGERFAGGCDTCHGAPPNSTSHGSVSQNDWAACMTCHPDTVTSTSPTVDPAKHINGSVEAAGACSSCHGDGASQDYPPAAVYGTDPNAANGVGAHVHHIENTAGLMTKEGTGGTVSAWCAECHTVPSDLTHIDNVYPADVTFAGGTESGYNGTTAAFTAEGDGDPDQGTGGTCSVYCHGANLPNGSTDGSNTTPSWGDSAPTANNGCGFCHGVPPSTTSHNGLTSGDLTQCVSCHPDTVNASGAIATPANHINGGVEVQADCSACHGDGSTKDYPPVGVHGNATTGNGVGAHVTHIENTAGLLTKQGSQTALVDKWCNECHAVPANVGDSGHIDSVYPADISFASGTESKLNSTTPAYTPPASTDPDSGTAGTCSVYCHGANMPKGTSDGSNTTPAWTDTAPTADNGCGFCHGFPPAGISSHSGVTSGCATCHTHVNGTDDGFTDPSKHINGTVEALANCTDCHDGVPAGATYVTRDVVGSDFTLSSRHVFGGTVSDYDCIVCHAEGDASQATSGTVATTLLHNNSGGIKVDLRDVDSPGTTAVQWDKNNTNNTMYTGLDTFCLSCHDSDGASGIAVVGNGSAVTTTPTSAQALGPFNDTDGIGTGGAAASGPVKVTGYPSQGNISTDDTLKVRSAVLDVKSQFATGNPSHHAVLGQRYTSVDSNWAQSTWVNTTLKSGDALQTTRETSRLHCADCHTVDVNAHGSNTPWMLTASGSGSPNSSPIDATCFQCHASSVYFNGTGGRWDHSIEGDAWSWKWKGNGGRYDVEGGPSWWGSTASTFTDGAATGNNDLSFCMNCHGGGSADETADTRTYGAIHGLTNNSDPRGGKERYRFMGGAYITANPGDNNGWTAVTEPTCYGASASNAWSTCSKHDGKTGAKGKTSWNYNYGRSTAY